MEKQERKKYEKDCKNAAMVVMNFPVTKEIIEKHSVEVLAFTPEFVKLNCFGVDYVVEHVEDVPESESERARFQIGMLNDGTEVCMFCMLEEQWDDETGEMLIPFDALTIVRWEFVENLITINLN